MSSHAATVPAVGIRLFPLLAVLLCTVGAVVPLMLIFARQAQMLASRSTVKAAEEETERQDLEWRMGILQQSRDQTETDLQNARHELSHLEDHLRQLRQRAQRLQRSATELEGLDKQAQRNATQAELEKLKESIRAKELEIADAKRKAAAKPVSYSVVPYEGPNQTRRRPIYIECSKDRVVLQPEGIVFTESDFEGPLGPGNPLAAALRAAREYIANSQPDAIEKIEPYPLVLVRPDAVDYYYATHAALASWGSQFGYELVGDDWDLKYPPADPQLEAEIRSVVAAARLRQQELALAAPKRFRNSGKATYHVKPRGGIERVDGGSDVAQGSGGRNPYRSRGDGNGVGRSSTGEYPYGRSGGPGTESTNRSGTGSGAETAGLGAGPLGAGIASRAGESGGYDREAGNAGSKLGGTGEELSGGVRDGAGSSGDGRQIASGSPYGTQADSRGGQGQTSLSGTGQSGRTGQSQSGPPGLANSSSSAGGETAKGTSPTGSGSTESSPTGSGSGRFGKRSGSPGGRDGGSADSGSSNSDPTAKQGGATPGSGSSGPMSGSGAPSLIQNLGQQRKPAGSLANTRGEDWGLPDANGSAVAVTRPIVIECRADRVRILGDDGQSIAKEITLAQRTEDSVDELVSSVWDHMKHWGAAGRGLYWKPTLIVRVAPDGNSRFADLQDLLANSGLELKQSSKPLATGQKPTNPRRK